MPKTEWNKEGINKHGSPINEKGIRREWEFD